MTGQLLPHSFDFIPFDARVGVARVGESRLYL